MQNEIEAGNGFPALHIEIPSGYFRLPAGAKLDLGDCIWRESFRAFIPFSPSQIMTCDRVLTGEVIIRRKESAA